MLLSKLVLTAMLTWVPAVAHKHSEAPEAATSRYEEIAKDIADVVQQDGPVEGLGEAKTALLMASIAYFESAYSKDVDTCKRRGDNGQAVTLWQLHQVNAERACKERAYAAHVALVRVKQSFAMCAKAPVLDRLSVYASGRSGCVYALRESQHRVGRALSFAAGQ